MKPKSLRFRQVHLDFHTAPTIERIGGAFDKKHWQETLVRAHVDSITCFSKCHHGLSYHPTSIGVRHPHLEFDLLRSQIDACREIDVRVPVYLSAGLDNTITLLHPEWREKNAEGVSGSPLKPGFHKLCFNSPYLDYLCRQIEEAVTLFPEGDGIFLDIISQGECCCPWCLEAMGRAGLNPENSEERRLAARQALAKYYEKTTAACKVRDARMPVFHNGGHVARGDREFLKHVSHLELESLPTGGWGYDHFPESASYADQLGGDFLGMTGKFHTTWGEFGGFKHPNALRYECAAMISFGARCSIGDQLHPDGRLDESTYAMIGSAYQEVLADEPWCRESLPVADIAVLSCEAENGRGAASGDADTGASRILLEGHYLFALVDRTMDFSPYRLLILPDNIAIDEVLLQKVEDYLHAGGKLLLTGASGLGKESGAPVFALGADYCGKSDFQPDYIRPDPRYGADFVTTPLVMYGGSHRIRVTTGETLGEVFDPYFNRTYRHFCSHQHAPNRPTPSGFSCGVRRGSVVYLAHPIFTLYRGYGAVAHKDYACKVIDSLLGNEKTVVATLPSEARVTLRRQTSERRTILHLLYATKTSRGGKLGDGTGRPVEVIEDLSLVHGAHFRIRENTWVERLTLEPQGLDVAFSRKDGRIEFTLASFQCHQMVVLHESFTDRGPKIGPNRVGGC